MSLPLVPHPWDAFGPPQPADAVIEDPERRKRVEELENLIAEATEKAETAWGHYEDLQEEVLEAEKTAEGLEAELEGLKEQLKELEGS